MDGKTLVPLLCEHEEDLEVLFDQDGQQSFQGTTIGTPHEIDSGGCD